MISSIVFDIGNVLLPFDFTPCLERLAANSDTKIEVLLDRLMPIKDQYESGLVSTPEFIKLACSQLGFHASETDFHEAWVDIFEPNTVLHDWARIAAERFPLYLLSNTNAMHIASVYEKYPVFQLFGGGIFSHEVHLLKPDRAIFKCLTDRFNLDPQSTLYIDDLKPNVEAARAEGYIAYEYSHHQHSEFLAFAAALGI